MEKTTLKPTGSQYDDIIDSVMLEPTVNCASTTIHKRKPRREKPQKRETFFGENIREAIKTIRALRAK